MLLLLFNTSMFNASTWQGPDSKRTASVDIEQRTAKV
jgi:hypothetical protein